MKQNITLSLETELLQQARVMAAKRHLSVSKLLAEDLAARVSEVERYEQARQQALAWLERKFPLGGQGIKNRDALHDRKNLR